MDIFGNFMLGFWFSFLACCCTLMGYLIQRDMIPPKRQSPVEYYGWKSLKYFVYFMAVVIFCVAANNFYESHHNFLLWLRS